MVFRQIDSDAAERLDESSWAAGGNRFLNRNPGSTDQCVKTFRMEAESGNICDARQQQTVVFSKDSISRQLNPNGWIDDRSYVSLSLGIDQSHTGIAA
ncbi:MAG TPA: hypothetical protein VFN26_16645 [Candidatus Acidoferrum sp.]|nr:hypothetical protein [Candidatus Acidoferrum sp.]